MGKPIVMTPTRVRVPLAEKVPLGIRLTEAERAKIVKLAHKYTGGNVSEWVRFTALNYKPKKKRA